MEENFFGKRLPKGKAIFRGLIIIIIDGIAFFGLNELHNFEIVPISFASAVIAFAVFMYGIFTMSSPFNYETAKKYLDKQNFNIDTPNTFLYKRYLIKWGKNGAYVYQKNGIVKWVIHDVTLNSEEEIKDYLGKGFDSKKVFDAIPYSNGE